MAAAKQQEEAAAAVAAAVGGSSSTGAGCGSSHHLHLSVSDGVSCGVVGGHLLAGTEVRTTAEVAIGELPGLLFARELCPRSGFLELQVSQQAPHYPPFLLGNSFSGGGGGSGSGLPRDLASFASSLGLGGAGAPVRVKRKYTKRANKATGERELVPGAFRCIKSPGVLGVHMKERHTLLPFG